MPPLHPLHALLLAGAGPVFIAALLSDVAYWFSYETQWKNFASWSIVWGLVLAGPALAWTLARLLRARSRDARWLLKSGLLLATCSLGVLNALVHASDAWASMPEGLALSALTGALALAAAWLALSDMARVPAR
jgi:uncharacterized membrane protein